MTFFRKEKISEKSFSFVKKKKVIKEIDDVFLEKRNFFSRGA